MGEAAVLALGLEETTSSHRWFSTTGCVVEHDGRSEVFVSGTLVGSFSEDDQATRDTLLMVLSEMPGVRYERLGPAFGIASETLRKMRRLREAEGLVAVLKRRKPGRPSKLTPRLRERLMQMFDDGLTIGEAHVKIRKVVSFPVVGVVRREWALAREQAAMPEPELRLVGAQEQGAGAEEAAASRQLQLVTEPIVPRALPASTASDGVVKAAFVDEEVGVSAPEEPSEARAIVATMPSSGQWVQHVGTWLMMSMLSKFGIHELAKAQAPTPKVSGDALRIALDALIAALAIGQGCVEGVRRLATATSSTLLRTRRCPSAPWLRKILGAVAKDGGAMRLLYGVAQRLVEDAEASNDEPLVFYIDNHMRPYTGGHVVRKGWRMQDHRVRPGSSDYYVHDEDGRPVMKVDVPEHDHLTTWLPRLARTMRLMLGPAPEILLAFDRAGSYSEHMVELRDQGFSFITYERKPYPLLASTAFDESFMDGDESIGVHESRINLGQGRGRLRRIALRMPDGKQVNLLTSSSLDAHGSYAIMRGRWRQENSFKHGNERWGINQLDGRSVVPYPPQTIVPNPARRRLDHTIRIAKHREGDLRCALARLGNDDTRRPKLEVELASAIANREQLEAQRPSVPKHAPLEQTELADSLVQHEGEYKMLIDTIRIGCANVESELALELARSLPRPAEAKKTLANLLAAPGHVKVGRTQISVTLAPAGTSREQQAMRDLLARCEQWNMSLPGDPHRRKLVFRVQH